MHFPKATYRTFKGNFLKAIRVTFQFAPNKKFAEWCWRAEEDFKEFDDQICFVAEKREFRVQGSCYAISFKEASCSFIFSPLSFSSFESVLENFAAHKALLQDLMGEKIETVEIVKSNLIAATTLGEVRDNNDFLHTVFSENLCPKCQPGPAEAPVPYAQFRQVGFRQEIYTLLISYGCQDVEDTEDGLLGVLELACKTSDVDSDSFIDKLRDMNAVVFDMFIWSLSPYMLNWMEE